MAVSAHVEEVRVLSGRHADESAEQCEGHESGQSMGGGHQRTEAIASLDLARLGCLGTR